LASDGYAAIAALFDPNPKTSVGQQRPSTSVCSEALFSMWTGARVSADLFD
jgi:hypothetical protein